MTNQLMLLAMVVICKEIQYTDCLYDGECLLFPHYSSLSDMRGTESSVRPARPMLC